MQKLREFRTTRSALQQMLKEIVNQKEKATARNRKFMEKKVYTQSM